MGYDMNKKGHKAVFGIFRDRMALENAVDSLKAAGYRNSDISVLLQSKGATEDFAHQKNTKAPEGATAGATGGAIAGASLGWLAGIGALTIPGIGPFLAAGPIMAAVAGAGLGGTIGGVAGGLIGMGFPEYEAKRFEGLVKDGGMLLSVHVDDSEWSSKAKDILETAGAKDISVASEESGSWSFKDENEKISAHYRSDSYSSTSQDFKRTDDLNNLH